MSTVGNVNAGAPVSYLTDFEADPTTKGLTPETLLLYCSSRLSALDMNIQQYVDEQQRRSQGMRDANKLLEIQGRYPYQVGSVAVSVSDIHQTNHMNQGNDLLDLYNSTSNPEVKERCAAAFKQVTGMDIGQFSGGRRVTKDDIAKSAVYGQIPEVSREQRTNQLEAIKGEQAGMAKSSEMSMIQLQALVSQRQLAVQLTTQMLHTMSEAPKQIVGNIR